MKKPLRLIAALLSFCVVSALFPPAGLAAERSTHSLSDGEDLLRALETVSDGDTVQCSGLISVGSTDATDAPWVIDKNVTIEGGTLSISRGGILLAANVTFRNTTLDFTTSMRNAIMANGYKLELDNVKAGNFSFNLFCGGLILGHEKGQFDVPDFGPKGEIIISGNTNLQIKDTYGSGNIYAGNLCIGGTDGSHNGPDDNGEPNAFPGDAVICIEDHDNPGGGVLPLGQIYAGGAQQRIPQGQLDGKETTPDPYSYTVDGSVTISGAKIPDVNGFGSAETNVVYRGGVYPVERTWSGISGLTVETGSLELASGSGFRADPALSVSGGALLNISGLDSPLSVGSFTGGGSLVLGADQTLTITGTVDGQTAVGIGGIFNNSSSSEPTKGHIYIQAPNSSDSSFRLLPHSSNSGITLVPDNNGNWTASDGAAGGDENLITTFGFLDKTASTAPGREAEFVMEAALANGDAKYLDNTRLTILVDWSTTLTPREDPEGEYAYIYQDTLGNFSAYVADNTLCITPAENGEYTISVTLPKDAVADGKTLSDTATLSVSDGGTTPDPDPNPDPSLTPIPVPTPVADLVYTGEELTGVHGGSGYTLRGHTGINVGTYTATAVLDSGYCWDDGTTEPRQIEWSIARAGGPAAPGGLAGIAPTAFNGTDGKITGTTAGMEYSRNENFADSKICGAGQTTGLSAGIYYVRMRQTGVSEAGEAAVVEVPAYGVPEARSIRVNSAGHKTDYLVDEALDVTGLTIEVLYADGSRVTVPVTADMISGFNSSQAAERQTLTVHYAGQSATYVIRVIPPESPDPSVPDHDHLWNTAWDTDGTHHWHNCTGEDCPILENSGKDGYAAHSAGAWVIDQAATAAQSGSRYRACSVCGRELVRETIPATGASSSGGRPSGGSSGGNTATNTVKNPDGSTTATSTNGFTGTVTETTRRPDGSQTVTETRRDGTVTTTDTAADGSTVKTVKRPDGSGETTVRRADGAAADVSINRDGRTEASVNLPSRVVKNAQGTGGIITLPIPEMPVTRDGASTVSVYTGSEWPVKVEIPAEIRPGAVAVIVGRDGTETVVRTCVLTDSGILAAVPDGASVKLMDNGTDFFDTRGHWAEDAIDFASARELFTGKTPSAFVPDAPMTRAMAATVLARLDGADPGGGTAWYEGGMAWAVTHGISDGKNPNGSVTREQLAAMLHRYAGSPAATERELRFTDADNISGYALEAMRWAVENGILSGYRDGTVMPGGRATRAQAAVIVMRYLEFLNR